MGVRDRNLLESLQSEKEAVGKLALFGHMEKRFHSRSSLEASVKSFVKNLDESKGLLRKEEMDTFLKRHAFDIRWCEKQ